MKNLIKITSLSIMLGAVMLVSSCEKTVVETPKDVVDVALGNPDFSTLTKLLTDNGLVGALKGPGPFTVFAPTNAAFAKIDATKFTKDELTNILKSHVIAGKVLAANVVGGTAAPTLGSVAYLSKNANGVFINGNSQVTTADVAASNGVIHIINAVITPPTRNIVQIAQDAKFTQLVDLVLAADASVATALSTASEKGLTVFAPTNAAFEELYKTLPKATLLLPANKKLLTDVLLYHVVSGRVFSTDLAAGEVATLNRDGAKIKIDLMGGAKVVGVKSGNSGITTANLLGTNGVVHVIDKVLLP